MPNHRSRHCMLVVSLGLWLIRCHIIISLQFGHLHPRRAVGMIHYVLLDGWVVRQSRVTSRQIAHFNLSLHLLVDKRGQETLIDIKFVVHNLSPSNASSRSAARLADTTIRGFRCQLTHSILASLYRLHLAIVVVLHRANGTRLLSSLLFNCSEWRERVLSQVLIQSWFWWHLPALKLLFREPFLRATTQFSLII